MDKKLMMAWLQGQAQKQELTTTKMQQKRLGIVPQAEQRVKSGESATSASTPKTLSEQLSAEEEAYAKSHKSMMASMIKQYGKEKGTRVFYASVRNAVKEKKD
jgi:hypothetical protein